MYYYSPSTHGFYRPGVNLVIPADAVVVSESAHQDLLDAQANGQQIIANANGHPVAVDPPAPTLQGLRTQYTSAIQQRLDEFARTRNYDGIMSACTYATSTIPQFAAEGQRCVALRDATWTTGYAILADVEAGNRPVPTVEQVLSELPELTWEVP